MTVIGLPKKLASWIAWRERQNVVKCFTELINPTKTDVLLEIGGPTGSAEAIVSLYKKVLIINISNINQTTIDECGYPENTQIIRGNGCVLPLKNGSVDYVFSNATIEHIPKAQWEYFSREVIRVAKKGIFISAPNFWFPFEPHYLFPFFQFLPNIIKRLFIMDFGLSIGYINKTNFHKAIHLPRKRELQNIYPNANIRGVGWGMPSIIPIHWICWMKK